MHVNIDDDNAWVYALHIELHWRCRNQSGNDPIRSNEMKLNCKPSILY